MVATPQLGYRPELDGLRALAVALVLVFHAELGVFRAGYVGVSVFFTLSGYLITRLLLDEHARTGRIDLRRFWARRARRLLPASAACVLGVVTVARFGWLPTTDDLRRDVLAAVFQVFNWSELAGSQTYTDLFSDRPGPLDHFWSLSIEEQFYWVWPLAVLLAARSGRTGPAVFGLAASAWVAAPVVALAFGADAAYWSTPARAGEMLSGAALAAVMARPDVGWRRERPARLDGITAVVGLVAIVGVALVWPTASGPAYAGWFPVFSLATVAVIAGTRRGGAAARALSARPAVAVGRTSYGLYLYHWPVFLVLDAGRVGVDGWALFAVRLAATAIVTALSFHLIEQPIRTGAARLPGVLAVVAGAAVVAVIAAGSLAGVRGRFDLPVAPQRAAAAPAPATTVTSSNSSATTTTLASGSTVTTTTTTVTTTTTDTATGSAIDPGTGVTVDPPSAASGSPADEGGGITSAGRQGPLAGDDDVPGSGIDLTADQRVERRLMDAALRGPLPLPDRFDPLRILVIGDSTAWALADGLFAWSEAHPGRIDVTLLAAPGCSWGSGELVDELAEQFKTACDDHLAATLEPTIADWSPHVVVVMTTFADLEEWIWSDDEGVLVPPSDAFAAHLAADYEAFVDRLRDAGAGRVVWVTGPRVMHSAHSDLGGPGDPGRMEMQHAVIDDLAGGDPNLAVLDLDRWYLASEYGPDDRGRSDRLHLDVPAATDIADRLVVPWLVEMASVEAVTERDGSTDD